MTVIAVVAAVDMVGIFSLGRVAVVTGTAGTGDLQVVDGDRRRPLRAVVAIAAHVGCSNVCRVLAGGCRAVVAGTAGPGDLRMIYRVRG